MNQRGWRKSDENVGREGEDDKENPHSSTPNVGANTSFELALSQQLRPGRERIPLLNSSSPARPPTWIGGAIPPHEPTGLCGLALWTEITKTCVLHNQAGRTGREG